MTYKNLLSVYLFIIAGNHEPGKIDGYLNNGFPLSVLVFIISISSLFRGFILSLRLRAILNNSSSPGGIALEIG